jgi:predicted nucleic acid-binding protein
MANVLVDTSAWIDFFRNDKGPTGDLLETLLVQDRVVLCGVVEMEIFQGLRKKQELLEVQTIFELIPYLEMTRRDFIASGTLWQNLRKKGKTLPSTDCLIAALCLRNDLALLSLDVHFDEIGEMKRIGNEGKGSF